MQARIRRLRQITTTALRKVEQGKNSLKTAECKINQVYNENE